MKELVILSGKGGTGKTSITAAFASLAKNVVLCDADVDAADLHLIMRPEHKAINEFRAGNEAIINQNQCTQCGLCLSLCRFDAVRNDFTIDNIACEGCGVCVDLCPEKAIDFPETICGDWYVSETRFAPMVHARLGIAQENSGKLVSLVRSEAKKLAQHQNKDLILTDGPPGIGCPVIASIGQATAILIVAEPTVSGLHDMERVVELANHFKIPSMACINKYDLNEDQTRTIEAFAKSAGVAIVGKIPFDPVFTKAMIEMESIFEYDNNSQASIHVQRLWDNVLANEAFNAPVMQILEQL